MPLLPRRLETALWLGLVLTAVCLPVRAQTVLDRIHARGAVRCASTPRPGLAQAGGERPLDGLLVDVCRALATAVLGTPDRIEYRVYTTPADFDRVRRHDDDVFFLSGREMANADVAGAVVPGPTVFIESDAVMVPRGSAAKQLADLAGRGICFLIGDTAEQGLEAWFQASGRRWFRHAFSEPSEMEDAYAVRRCDGLAAEATELARIRGLSGHARAVSRILPEPLVLFPIVAATGLDDARWSAVVAWTVHTLIDGAKPASPWFAGGASAMPVAAPELDLSPGWQAKVLDSTGDLGAMFARHLGADSALQLDAGPNRPHSQGGLLLSPFVE